MARNLSGLIKQYFLLCVISVALPIVLSMGYYYYKNPDKIIKLNIFEIANKDYEPEEREDFEKTIEMFEKTIGQETTASTNPENGQYEEEEERPHSVGRLSSEKLITSTKSRPVEKRSFKNFYQLGKAAERDMLTGISLYYLTHAEDTYQGNQTENGQSEVKTACDAKKISIQKHLSGCVLAAKLGDPKAQHIIGSAYYSGTFVEKDIDQAIDYFQRSAHQGNAGAALLLTIIYNNEANPQYDNAKAYIWGSVFQKLYEQTKVKSQYMKTVYDMFQTAKPLLGKKISIIDRIKSFITVTKIMLKIKGHMKDLEQSK